MKSSSSKLKSNQNLYKLKSILINQESSLNKNITTRVLDEHKDAAINTKNNEITQAGKEVQQ